MILIELFRSHGLLIEYYTQNPSLEPIASRVPTGPLTTRVHILLLEIPYSEEDKDIEMTARLTTTLRQIERDSCNRENSKRILQFFEFMKKIGTSERYQNNNLKAIINFSKFLGPSISLNQVNNRVQITSFLDTKIKAIEQDPDKRWITTWNDYLGRIKYFFRWLHNYDDKRFDDAQFF